MKRTHPLMARWIPILLVSAVIVSLCVVPAIAYFVKYSDEKEHTLYPAISEDPVIDEGDDIPFDSIDVGDPGYPVYVRATILVTWQTQDGTVYFMAPKEDTDYELSLNDDWIEGDDGIYYYGAYYGADRVLKAVESGERISAPITSVRKLTEVREKGYFLHVELLVETIQAVGWTDEDEQQPAVADAWDWD